MYYNLRAIILKRQAFRENDLLVTVYSRERGKIALQAKGAKKIKSKLAGHLEPVSLSCLEVAAGKKIDQLIGARLEESYQDIKADLTKLAYASYFLELVERLAGENQPEEKIFKLLRRALDYLSNCQLPIINCQLSIVRISFGFKLLDILGLNPEQKQKMALSREIKLIIGSSIDKIKSDKSAINNLAGLNKILRRELEEHLEGRLKSEEFLEKLISNNCELQNPPNVVKS